MIRLTVFKGEEQIQEFESGDDKEISLGRAQGCTIRLEEATISRLHAVIFPLNGGWVLQRKANFGAVLLNGQEVENAPLEGGEEVTIGSFSVRVQIEGDAPVSLSNQSLVSSNSTSEPTGLMDTSSSEDGRTRVMSTGLNALFRMEPGAANIDDFLMDKELAVFGRGSNCDVVLTEKKASRKHFEVRRQGLSFFLKDLNSANGTVVNGNKVTETELMAGDLIEVGASKISFSVENKDYFNRQDQFLAVPSHLDQAPMAGGFGGMPGDPMAGGMAEGGAIPGADGAPKVEMGPDGTPLPPKPNSSTDFIGHFKYRWAQIPKAQRMRYLSIIVIGIMVMGILGGPDEEVKKPKPKPRNEKGEVVRRFEDLTPKNQQFVKENYKELLAAHEKKDFNRMADRARAILSLVDDYNDTRSYEQIARKGLDQIEEENKRRANDEKLRKTREEVAKLEEKGKEVFERALKDAAARPELDVAIQEIVIKDPNNRLAGEWKQKIREKIEEERREIEAAKQREETKQKAEDAYAAVVKTFNEKKYLQAIAEADGLGGLAWSEKEFLDKVEKLKADIRQELRTVLDPLLSEANTQRQDGGDLVKARDAYNKVLAVDPTNTTARQGLNDIRQILMLRAKRAYSEAILAESISDLQEAKEKYEKCLHTAPDDENLPPNQDYRRRCQRKLLRYEAFTPESSTKN